MIKNNMEELLEFLLNADEEIIKGLNDIYSGTSIDKL